MTKRQILDVVFVAFALFLLVRLVTTVFAGSIGVWMDWYAQTPKWFYFFSLVVYAAALAGAAYLLLFRRTALHTWVGADDHADTIGQANTTTSPEDRMAFWLSVLGMFMIVQALPPLFAMIILPKPDFGPDMAVQVVHMDRAEMIKHIASIVIGIVLIWRRDLWAQCTLRGVRSKVATRGEGDRS